MAFIGCVLQTDMSSCRIWIQKIFNILILSCIVWCLIKVAKRMLQKYLIHWIFQLKKTNLEKLTELRCGVIINYYSLVLHPWSCSILHQPSLFGIHSWKLNSCLMFLFFCLELRQEVLQNVFHKSLNEVVRHKNLVSVK